MLSDEYLGELLRAELHAIGDDIQPTAEFMTRLMPRRRFGFLHRFLPSVIWRRPVWVLAPSAGALGVGGAVLAIVLGTSGAAAYGVSVQGRTVSITLDQITAVSGLNRELARLGLSIRAVRMTDTCATKLPDLTLSVGRAEGLEYTLVNAPQPKGTTVVIAAEELPSGQFEDGVVKITGALPSCVSSKVGIAGPGMPGFVPTRTGTSTVTAGSSTGSSGTSTLSSVTSTSGYPIPTSSTTTGAGA